MRITEQEIVYKTLLPLCDDVYLALTDTSKVVVIIRENNSESYFISNSLTDSIRGWNDEYLTQNVESWARRIIVPFDGGLLKIQVTPYGEINWIHILNECDYSNSYSHGWEEVPISTREQITALLENTSLTSNSTVIYNMARSNLTVYTDFSVKATDLLNSMCYSCGSYLGDEDAADCATNRSGDRLCPDCSVRYVHVCSECGAWGSDLPPWDSLFYIEDNDTFRCENCLDGVVQCDRCGNFFHSLVDVDDMRLCNSCFESVGYEAYVKSWDYKPDELKFTSGFSDSDVRTTELRGKRYVGLELEFDDGSSKEFVLGARDKAEELGCKDMFYFMHDGSLEYGVEVTTVPLELSFALNEFPFEFICEQAKEAGMRANDTSTCGFHIHVNNASLGRTRNERDITVAKLMLVFDKFYANLLSFARRDSINEADRWCAKPNAAIERHEENYASKTREAGDNHYKSINIRPSYTTEIRLWKGTMSPDVIRSTIDFTSAMLDYCMNTPLEQIYDSLWDDFLAGVLKYSQYNGTKKYIASRGLLKGDTTCA